MKLDEINKFEAETCRIVALIAGTPAGTLLHGFLTQGVEFNSWLIAKAVVIIASWQTYILFINKARVRIKSGIRL